MALPLNPSLYRRYLKPLVTAGILCILLPLLSSPVGAAGLIRTTLYIETQNGLLAFQVDVANTIEQREKGLQHRHAMGPDIDGMLFIYDPPQPATMWMKDTFIALDMIFIDASGKITEIHPERQPLSLTHVHSRDTVQAVLELEAGTAKRLGIAPGDHIACTQLVDPPLFSSCTHPVIAPGP